MSPRDVLGIEPFGPVVVRAPLLAASRLHAWAERLRCTTAKADPVVPDDLRADREALRAELRAWLADPIVREAIFVASPSLASRLPKWEANPEGKDGAKIESALLRYVLRMSARSTPFGLFAGFAVGRFGEETSLEGFGAHAARRNVRVDMGILVGLAEALEQDPAIKDHLILRPNASMYEIGGRLHVPSLRATLPRRYEIATIEPDDALRRALERAAKGAKRREIAKALRKDDVSLDDALAYVDELLAARVLESSLAPPITSADPLADLVAELRAAQPAHPAVEKLDRLGASLRDLSRLELGQTPAAYETATRALAELDVKVEQPLQVDLSYGNTPTLGPEIPRMAARAIELLYRLAPQDDPLSEFRAAFTERYEGREVPLLEALDEQVGVGFPDDRSFMREPTPILDGLGLPVARGTNKTPPDVSAIEALLLTKLEEAWATGARTIEITDEDAREVYDGSLARLPHSFFAFASILKEEGRTKLYLPHWTGPSAARLLGRFASWSPELTEGIRAHLAREEALRPDAVFAEIVHMPDASRAANVLVRPVLRKHEIAFCGRSGAAPDDVIAPRDLMVSVVGDRIVLRSRRLDKEVVPRLTSAHNFQGRQLTVYRFLAALQGQGSKESGYFSWHRFGGARFLPRVVSGDVILAPARYKLSEDELKPLAKGTPESRYDAVKKLRAARGLPRHVGVEEGDNVLPIDLDNSLAVDALASAVKSGPVTLVELFLGEEWLSARGEGGAYTNEVLLPFVRKAAPAKAARRETRAPSATRSFPPGSEWLYAKIYCARASADAVLRGPVAEVVRRAARSYDDWFFIRYADPHPHIRLRFHGDPKKLTTEVLPELTRALKGDIANGRVSKVVLDTYERELERYGGDHAMPIAERFFGADSRAALRIVELEPDVDFRWLHALVGMNDLFDAFGFDAKIRDGVNERCRKGYEAEMHLKPDQEHRLADRYRLVTPKIRAALAGEGMSPALKKVFADRKAEETELAKELRALRRAGKSLVTSEELVGSLLHMWNNRMLPSSARQHELVLHSFLERHYASLAARAKKEGTT